MTDNEPTAADPTPEQRETLGHALCRHHAKHRIIGSGVVLHHLDDSEEVPCDSCRAAINALSAVLADLFAAARAEAWDEGAEATAEWSAAYTHGDNGPPDPPRNPYATEADRG